MARFSIPQPDEESAFAQLDIIIEDLKRFALVLAICASDEAADAHIAHYQEHNPSLKITTVNLLWPESRIYSRLTSVYEAEHPDIMMVTGMAAWTERGDDAKGNEFTASINLARDGLHDDIHCPVVFWCTPTVYNFIRRNAHDFYSVATATLRLSLPQGGDEDTPFALDTNAIQALSQTERQARILDLTKALEATAVSGSPRRQLDLLSALGRLHFANGQYDATRSVVERARVIAERVGLATTPDYAYLVHELANVERATGNYTLAKMLYSQALLIEEATLGRQHPHTATTIHELASVEQDIGNFAAAKTLYEEALLIEEATLGRSHPTTAGTLHELANIDQEMGNFSDARRRYEQVLVIKETNLGPYHPDTAATLHELANIDQKTGNYASAKTLYEQVLAIYDLTIGPNHPNTATTLHNLAVIAANAGDFRTAQALAEQARAVYELSLGARHPRTKGAYQLLSQIYTARGDIAAAAEMAAKVGQSAEVAVEAQVLVS